MGSQLGILVGVAFGVLMGVGGYTFIYARGGSYFTDDSAACANCHIMQEQFDGWQRSSHRRAAVCNDCHTPHNNVVAKYATKATNGFWHSFYFTFGGHPDPIRITARNRRVTEDACRYCHGPIVQAIDTHPPIRGELSCINCHRNVGHLH